MILSPLPLPLGKIPQKPPSPPRAEAQIPPKTAQMLVRCPSLVSKIPGLYQNLPQKSTQMLYFSEIPFILPLFELLMEACWLKRQDGLLLNYQKRWR